MIDYNVELYNGGYIYTVKCQSSVAMVYEIKKKFFNLIINSEAKLYQILELNVCMKRNIMMKFLMFLIIKVIFKILFLLIITKLKIKKKMHIKIISEKILLLMIITKIILTKFYISEKTE